MVLQRSRFFRTIRNRIAISLTQPLQVGWRELSSFQRTAAKENFTKTKRLNTFDDLDFNSNALRDEITYSASCISQSPQNYKPVYTASYHHLQHFYVECKISE